MNLRRLQREEGWVVVTAVVLTAIMLTLALAAYAFVDTQQKQSGRERERESRLNLTEGVLASEIYTMSRDWPDTASNAYPAAGCTETPTGNPSIDSKCPTASQVRSHFSAVDFKLGSTWKVNVVDNPGTAGKFYSDALLAPGAAANWDQSGPNGVPDGEMWLRAEGRLGDKKRVVVARVRVEKKAVQFPDGPFVAGSFRTGNSGNKTIVSTGGKNGIVRCDNGTADPSYRDNTCEGYDPGQVQPVGTVISDPSTPTNLIPAELIDAERQAAKAANTYYPTCPSGNWNPTGAVVFVESGDCDFHDNMTVNSAAHPGLFIINNGTVKVSGNITWYGVIYALNAQNWGASNGPVVELTGDADIRGGVFVDGAGLLSVGNSKQNLTYDPLVKEPHTVYGTAGIIQNTWRELTSG